MMRKNDKTIIKISYLKHHSEFQMHYGYGKLLHSDKQRSNNNYKKEKSFYEPFGSSQQYSEMIDFALKNYKKSEVVIELWSVFDLNIWQFWTIAENYKVVSTLESEEQLNDYFNMVEKFMEQEKDCIVDPFYGH